jgi:hypothetical protein
MENRFKLAETFADGVLDAVRSATVEEILSGKRIARKPSLPPPPRRPARPSRAPARKPRSEQAAAGSGSGASNDAVVATLLGVLAKEPNGVRSEELRAKLGVDRRVMATAIAYTLSTRQIRKTGSRRSTTYHLAATKPTKPPSIAPAPAASPTPRPRASSSVACCRRDGITTSL